MSSWFFPPIAPHRVQGRGLAEDNFAAEERQNEEIMGREGYQNALDARVVGSTASVRVSVKILNSDEFDVSYLRGIINPEYEARLKSATEGASHVDFSNARVLVIEDFGTTGLEGTFVDSTIDGEGENWNAFWFREGEGAKAGRASNGRAGQGKITFYRIGRTRVVFGFTTRESDSKALLMGRSSFRRDYAYGDRKFERDSFWCFRNQDQILPTIYRDEIDSFRRAFKLQRTFEPGLSLVIPFPIEFDNQELLRTAIADFYLPIARGRLEVQIGDEIIRAENLDIQADRLLPDDLARQKKWSFTKGFRSMVQRVLDSERNGKELIKLNSGWEKSATLKEQFLPDGALNELRSQLDRGDLISVRLPVTVKPKRGATIETWFDVHLEVPQQLDRVEEAYVRRDLLIGSESHLAASSYLPKARGLTLIEDDGISAFLADAEEPTHLKWNASRPRLSEDYKAPKDLVRAVRLAMPRLLALLAGGDAKRDVRALAKYFTKPAEIGARHEPGGRKEGVDTTIVVEVPEPRKKPFRLETGADHIVVRPNALGPTIQDLPMECELEAAYEGLDQDPFAAYDPFDFDLSDTNAFKTSPKGVNLLEVKYNRIRFEIVDPDFEVKVSGFDPNIRLRAKMTYREKENGANIDS